MKLSPQHILIIGLVFWLSISSGIAQDIHFSQFNQAPARLNPALTGQFKGGYRIAGIYRSQWASVTVPYSTIAFSGDAHNFLKMNGLGAGLDIFYDKAGDGNLGTLNFNVSGSYSIAVTSDKKSHLTLGTQIGWAQKQLDPSQLVFDNSYSGGPDESYNTGFSYINVNAGILWETRFAARKKLQLGVALHNITQPKSNFFDNGTNKLEMRTSVHANYQFPISDKVDLIPGVLAMFQGPHQQITPGINVKYILDPRTNNYRAVYVGAWTRANDAAFVNVGMDWNSLNVGVSYDFNYSSLTTASRYRGGFEISFIYIFSAPLPDRKKYKTCPDYI